MGTGKRKDKRKRLLLRWSWVMVLCAAAPAGIIAAIHRSDGEAVPAAGGQVEGLTSVLARGGLAERVPIRFEDVTARMGIAFEHFPAERNSLLPEDMGSGVACGDFDGDGFTDLYFVNFAGSIAPGAEPDRERGRSRLYRNVDGQRFEDVTERAGVGFAGYGMGAAWGDYDADGDLDLYVTGYGDNALYENRDGVFEDVTELRGVQDRRFSAGCAWSDYDGDGDLDLYVCNYVAFSYRGSDARRMAAQYATEQPYTLNPSSYPAQPNALFRNNGDGTFTDVAREAGVADPDGRSLAAAWVDMDNDGRPDLYVANDVSINGVFRNNGDGTFADIGAESLAGDYRGAMGIAVADVDGDLDWDLLITHWLAQENALYRNMLTDRALGAARDGKPWFMDDAETLGLGQIALDMVGWATGFCDFDNDGRLDLWIVNGSTLEQGDDRRQLVGQRAFVFWNHPDRGFVDVASRAAACLARPMCGRGGAQLDFDRDGRMDLVLTVHGGRPLLLHNTSPDVGHWLTVELGQTGGDIRSLGATVRLTAGGITRMGALGGSASYLSQNEGVIHFGLGESPVIDELRITWPDGAEEVLTKLECDQRIVVGRTDR